MIGLDLLVVAAVAVLGLGAGVAAVAVLVARNRRRRNRVVPEQPTRAPDAWAGAHTPLARLHRRLVKAVATARAVPDPDGALIRARVEVEQTALAVDEHLVVLHELHERDRASRMPAATAAVAGIEQAVARLADTVGGPRQGALPAVEEALERARLVAEARAELDGDGAGATDAVVIDATPEDQDEGRSEPGTA